MLKLELSSGSSLTGDASFDSSSKASIDSPQAYASFIGMGSLLGEIAVLPIAIGVPGGEWRSSYLYCKSKYIFWRLVILVMRVRSSGTIKVSLLRQKVYWKIYASVNCKFEIFISKTCVGIILNC